MAPSCPRGTHMSSSPTTHVVEGAVVEHSRDDFTRKEGTEVYGDQQLEANTVEGANIVVVGAAHVIEAAKCVVKQPDALDDRSRERREEV